MAVRITGNVLGTGKEAMSSIEAAIVAEKAASLGHAGHLLEKALAKLRAAEVGADRQVLIDHAAERAWAYFTQRELCGLRDNDQAVADYAIPPEVMARIGVQRRA